MNPVILQVEEQNILHKTQRTNPIDDGFDLIHDVLRKRIIGGKHIFHHTIWFPKEGTSPIASKVSANLRPVSSQE